MKLFRKLLNIGLGGNSSGGAAIEFAIVLPLMIIIFLPTVDIARFLILKMKMERVVHNVVSHAAQSISCEDNNASSNRLDIEYLTDIINHDRDMLLPASFSDEDKIVVTSLFKDPAGMKFHWQFIMGTDIPDSASTLGTIPAGHSYRDAPTQVATNVPADMFNNSALGENVIVAEVFFGYTPIFLDITLPFGLADFMRAHTMKTIAYMAPHNGNLTFLPTYSGASATTTTAAYAAGCI